MTTQGKATFEVTAWDEKPYLEEEGTPKLTQAHVKSTFSGDIEGTGHAAYLMAYPNDTTATFVGLQRVAGKVMGREGTFVLQANGTFANGIARADWSVVPDSGTGELAGLSGTGGYESRSDGSAEVTLDFDLA